MGLAVCMFQAPVPVYRSWLPSDGALLVVPTNAGSVMPLQACASDYSLSVCNGEKIAFSFQQSKTVCVSVCPGLDCSDWALCLATATALVKSHAGAAVWASHLSSLSPGSGSAVDCQPGRPTNSPCCFYKDHDRLVSLPSTTCSRACPVGIDVLSVESWNQEPAGVLGSSPQPSTPHSGVGVNLFLGAPGSACHAQGGDGDGSG